MHQDTTEGPQGDIVIAIRAIESSDRLDKEWFILRPSPFSSDSSRTITVILLDVQTVTSVIRACHTAEWGARSFGTFHIQGPLARSGRSALLYYNMSLKENGQRTMKCWAHTAGTVDWGPSCDRGRYNHIMTNAINLTKPWNVKQGPHEHWSETLICCLSGN